MIVKITKLLRSIKLIAPSLSRKLSRLLPVMYTTTIAFVKNIRTCSVLLNGKALLARAKFSLKGDCLNAKLIGSYHLYNEDSSNIFKGFRMNFLKKLFAIDKINLKSLINKKLDG